MKEQLIYVLGSKVQFLLVGKEINLALSVTGAERESGESHHLKNAFQLGATCQEHLKDRVHAKRSGRNPSTSKKHTVQASESVLGSTGRSLPLSVVTPC